MRQIQLKINDENVYPIVAGAAGGVGISAKSGNPLPRNAKIYITSALLSPNASNNTISPLTTSKNEVGDLDNRDVMLRFVSDSVNFEDAIVIAYQGNSTLQNPKKGFSIDFAEKHTFGEWLAFDGFHLKGYYIDWTHTRDLVCNHLLEQVYQSRNNIRPYLYHNNFSASGTYKLQECRAYCHIDGFPCELYINDVYWGLYSLNTKKSVGNYFLDKNDTDHIMFEPDDNPVITTAGWNWTKIEFRCPKGAITNKDGTPYDGDNPKEINDGPVKTETLDFVSKLSAITSATTKAQLNEFIVTDNFVDWYLFNWFIDNFDIVGKNTLFTTWDGAHWTLLIYDMDNTFGMYAWSTGDAQRVATADTFADKANTCGPWISPMVSILSEDIQLRYAELRNLGIFSHENLTNLFNERTTLIGADYYKKDLGRWTYPSYGGSGANFYFTTKKALDWIADRIAFLDNKFGYNG